MAGQLLSILGNQNNITRRGIIISEFGTMHSPQEQNQSKNLNVIGNELPKEFKQQTKQCLLSERVRVSKVSFQIRREKGSSNWFTIWSGPAMLLLKPYYLKFIEQVVVNGELESILVRQKFSEENKTEFIDYGSILRRCTFFYRTQKNQHFAGISGKGRFVFSVGAFDEYVKAAEVGKLWWPTYSLKKCRLWYCRRYNQYTTISQPLRKFALRTQVTKTQCHS